MLARYGIVLTAAVILAQRTAPPSFTAPDPATNLVRTRLFVTTTASSVDVAVDGARVATAIPTVRLGPVTIRTNLEQDTLRITGNFPGQTADVQIDTILAAVPANGSVGWTLTPAGTAATRLEVQNLNRENPAAVDRFDTSVATRFVSSGALLLSGGPIPAPSPIDTHLVLAFFYPWYDLTTWSSPDFMDTPTQRYSTDDPTDMTRVMSEAKGSGLDAVVVTWSGKDDMDGWHHRKMLRCLEAAQAAKFKVATLFETTVANPQHQDGIADPDTVFNWLVDVVDLYASQPAYLRVHNRPVVIAYAAQRMSQAGWATALSRLRATGRDVLLIGEGSNTSRLGGVDGQFFYASNAFTSAEIGDWNRQQSLNVRTYYELPSAGTRRIWLATVSPGYNDLLLKDGRVPRVSERDAGRYYERQWQSAIDMRADWVVVTSWNEYWENTQIESSRRYGDLYERMTRIWAERFRQLRAVPRSAAQ